MLLVISECVRCSVFCAGVTSLKPFECYSVTSSQQTCYSNPFNLTVAYCQSQCLTNCPTCLYTLVEQPVNEQHMCCACYTALTSLTVSGSCTDYCKDDTNLCGEKHTETIMSAYYTGTYSFELLACLCSTSTRLLFERQAHVFLINSHASLFFSILHVRLVVDDGVL